MGIKLYSTFEEELTLALGQRTDISSYTGRFINSSYLDFTTRKKFWKVAFPQAYMFPELNVTDATQATVASRAYISVPTDCLHIYTVHDTTNDNKLSGYSLRQYVEETGRASSTGKPDFWFRMGSYIYLYPTPTGAYSMTIFYRKKPALLVNPTDVTVIGSEWDEPILSLAVCQTFLKLKYYDDFKFHKDEWIDMMAGKIGIYDEERKDKNDIMEPSVDYLGYRK